MAAEAQAAQTGRDLASIAARARRARQAWAELAEFSHEHLDDLQGFFGSDVAVKRVYTRASVQN